MTTKKPVGRPRIHGRFCVGCGKRLKLTYPAWEPVFCSMRCAAGSAFAQHSAGDSEFFCELCGEWGRHGMGYCPREEEEQA